MKNSTSRFETSTDALAPSTNVSNVTKKAHAESMTSPVTQAPNVNIANTSLSSGLSTIAIADPVTTVKPRIKDEKLCSSKIDAAIPGRVYIC